MKYLDSSRKGLISIYAETGNDKNTYCIEDNGIGIDPNHQNKVFEKRSTLEEALKKALEMSGDKTYSRDDIRKLLKIKD